MIFSDKDNGDEVYDLVKGDDWIDRLINEIKNYLSCERSIDVKIISQSKFVMKKDDSDDKHRSKSLATIYNYFIIKKIPISKGEFKYKVDIRKGQFDELYKYITNEYTKEHFIINDCGNCKIVCKEGEKIYKYPANIKKYNKSIFDLLFIKSNDNEALSNQFLGNKFAFIEGNLKIDCEYSKMAYVVFKDIMYPMPELLETNTYEENSKILDEYYNEVFKEQYSECVNKIVEKIQERFKAML